MRRILPGEVCITERNTCVWQDISTDYDVYERNSLVIVIASGMVFNGVRFSFIVGEKTGFALTARCRSATEREVA